MQKMKFLIPVFALAALAFTGCSDDGDDDKQPSVTRLELADPSQAALSFEATNPKPQTIALTTDATADAIKVAQVLAQGESKADWCVVTVKSATQITVAPASNNDNTARSAKFAVTAGTLPAVEFTVTQDYPEPADATLSIDLQDEWGSYSFAAPAAGGDVTVTTVTTNMHGWTAEFDPGFDEENPYCSLKTASGASGDVLIVNFKPNTLPMMQSGASVTISAGNAEPITIYLNQNPPLATTATVYDAEWTNVLTSPHAVSFAKDEAGAANKQEFGVEADGGCEVKIVAEGTSTEVTDSWIESYYGTGSWFIHTVSANTTGSDRKLDVILVGEGGRELFRMKVTQAGA